MTKLTIIFVFIIGYFINSKLKTKKKQFHDAYQHELKQLSLKNNYSLNFEYTSSKKLTRCKESTQAVWY
ncbi:MAG: hypothetical protein KBF74_09650, partial [Ferruginibacter sp.]|nr:hypothetical protein [Ferruginibacter sp.]